MNRRILQEKISESSVFSILILSLSLLLMICIAGEFNIMQGISMIKTGLKTVAQLINLAR